MKIIRFFVVAISAAMFLLAVNAPRVSADVVILGGERFVFVGAEGAFEGGAGAFDESLSGDVGGTTATGVHDSFFISDTIAAGVGATIGSGTFTASLTATEEVSGADNANAVEQFFGVGFTVTSATDVTGSFVSSFTNDPGLDLPAIPSFIVSLSGANGVVAGAFDGGVVTLEAGDYSLDASLFVGLNGLQPGVAGPAGIDGNLSFSLATVAVPEPSSSLAMLIASTAWVVRRRRLQNC